MLNLIDILLFVIIFLLAVAVMIERQRARIQRERLEWWRGVALQASIRAVEAGTLGGRIKGDKRMAHKNGGEE